MKWNNSVGFGLLLAVAFLVGQRLPVGELDAQGRGPVQPSPPPARPTDPAPGSAPAPQVVYSEESGQSSSTSGGGFLAVTGSYGVGTSVLYLIDTVSRQLAVYEARGGSSDMRRIVFVGARRIDLDLQLEGYNDRSEFEYERLRDLFQRRDSKDAEVTTGLEPQPGGRR